jgi:hypothetical protein
MHNYEPISSLFFGFRTNLVRYCQLLLPVPSSPFQSLPVPSSRREATRRSLAFLFSAFTFPSFLSIYLLLPSEMFPPEHGKSACRLWANTTVPHMVRTTRNSAFPLIMRAYPSAAFASGYFSIIARTPVISANCRVSCESVGMPPAQPLMPFLPKSN